MLNKIGSWETNKQLTFACIEGMFYISEYVIVWKRMDSIL